MLPHPVETEPLTQQFNIDIKKEQRGRAKQGASSRVNEIKNENIFGEKWNNLQKN